MSCTMLFRWLRGTFNHKRSRSSQKNKSLRTRPRTSRPRVEPLEDRFLPSINIGPNVNISRASGNQNEETIAISPLVNSQGQHDLFEASNDEGAPIPAFGLLGAFSHDGGKT